MTKKIFSESEVALAREFCRQDFYFFVRWMFYHNKRIDWIKNGHHEIMARAMNDVFYKKITRLIINIAPRYGKTEMVIVLFSAWALGKFPDSEFIHASYSGTLAGENAYNTRQIVTHPEYQAIFPDVQLRADSKSKDHWKTTKGGVFYATGTGGTCTGYGAGKERDDFGGCFPYEELVSTDKGYLCIGDIVEKRLSVKVHSFNFKTHKVELQPIDTFWHNPANDIIKIELNDGSVFKCTPNHKIMTSNGWIEAQNLTKDDLLPKVFPDVFDLMQAEYRFPVFINKIGYVDKTYCLEVRSNNNFFVSQGQVLVSNCILLDDPHKADEARSDAMRNGVLEWYGNTLQSRVNSSNTPIVLIMQRLHEQDLAGWLLDGGSGEKWEHINIPAINADGTALWPHKHTIEKLREMEQANPYNFSGQYLQLPSPPDGGLFKPEQLKIMEVLPIGEKIQWVRGWDLASSTNGDFTVGAKLGRMADGRLVIGDIVRIKVNADERDAIIQNTAAFDGNMCKISLPQDPGQAGKTQILYLTRSLQGYRVVSSMESGNKVIRAEPFAAQVNIGNVYILRGAWNQALINEMRMFPNGKNDDQIDALSRCFEQLLTGGMGFKISSAALERASRFNRRRF